MSVEYFLINDWFRRAQPAVSSAAPGQVVLGWIRKQTEQTTESKPVSNTPPWPLLQFLPAGSCLGNPHDELRSLSYIDPHLPVALGQRGLAQQLKTD